MRPSATPDPHREPNALASRIRTLRTDHGITLRNAAQSTGCSETMWRRWEAGTSTPLLDKAQRIANALGVPVLALFEPYTVAEVVLSPAAVERVRREGMPAAEALAVRLSTSLAPLILAAATPAKPQPSRRAARGKPRRSRAEVLQGIQAANTARAARATAGPPEGPAASSHGGLPGPSAGDQASGGLSTLRAEEPEGDG